MSSSARIRTLVWLSMLVTAPAAAQSTEPEPTFLSATPGPDRNGGPGPSPEERASLREMEREMDAFGARAAAYHDTITELGRRELGARRRTITTEYERRIGTERALETAARDRAIALMERFVASHPSDEPATPDAMLRLGELYAERTMEHWDASGAETPDYAPTIATYRSILERFPSYARAGSALYLLGYCLDREGQTDDAIAAWRRAVCPEGDYETCSPLGTDRALNAEMWLRIGSADFDAPDPAANDRAAQAFTRALDGASPRVRSLATYMLAWAHYRDGSYQEAIARFTDLVDEDSRAGGGSALRAEAIDYVAIALADADWNADAVDDVDQGLPSPLARATDPTLIAQDRPWTIEVLLALGRVAFDEAHYASSIAVLEEAVRRWPMDHRVPAALVSIVRAAERMGDEAAAAEAAQRLALYDETSAWARHNEIAHAREVAEADRLARTFGSRRVLGDAVRCHERAQSARSHGQSSDDAYACAVSGYRAYLSTHATDPESYGIALDLADALFWSSRYEEAAHAYEDVRDSALSDADEASAAHGAVESYRRAIQSTGIGLPSAPSGNGIAEVPPLVAAMARARETYLTRIDASRDRDRLRTAYALNQALLLDGYGYTQHAQARLTALFDAGGCDDDAAATYRALRAITIRNEGEEAAAPHLEALATSFASRTCEAPASAASCDDDACAADALCTARCDLTAIAYRRGLDTYHRAEHASGAEQRALFEQAATMLLHEVDRAPDHPDVPQALLVIGDALDRSGHDTDAARIYERAVDELAPRHPANAERRDAVDRALAQAWLRLGNAAMRVFDDERATSAFGALARSDRFASSTDSAVIDARTDAWIGLARIEERTAQYANAAQSYTLLASAPTSMPDEVRLASFEAAEMHHLAHDWPTAARAMRDFATRFPEDADHVVLAWARIADAERAQHHRDAERAALRGVIDAYERVHGTPGSAAGALAADAALRIADDDAASFTRFAITPGAPATLRTYVDTIGAQVSVGAARAQSASAGYERVASYGHAPSTIAALDARGAIDERLARGVLDTPFVVPRDLARTLRRASPEVRRAAEADLAARVATTLDGIVRPVECRAITRYVLAARLARRSALDDVHTQHALERLASYGEDRIVECVAAAHAEDASFEPYAPGEITRVPRGLDADVVGATATLAH